MKASKPLLRDAGSVVFIFPANTPCGVLGHCAVHVGTLRAPEGSRAALVLEGTAHVQPKVAWLIWRYEVRGTLMVTREGLWIAYSQDHATLRGVRLHTKQPWFIRYGLVDAELPR